MGHGAARLSGDFTKETERKIWRFNPQKDAGIHMDSNYVYYVEIDGLIYVYLLYKKKAIFHCDAFMKTGPCISWRPIRPISILRDCGSSMGEHGGD